jgi:mannose-6-phosphate isomerase-like protein (cupin superfamily)
MRIINSNLDIHKRIIPKAWGQEIIIHNGEEYCGKILRFNQGAKFSMHFHIKKKETWYVASGTFLLTYIDTRNATEKEKELNVGDIIDIERGDPHQLHSITGGDIFEVSTQHFDDDSYRIAKGDSQNG